MTQLIERKLAAHNVRPTKQRMQLAQILFGDEKPRHFTAEELFVDAQKLGYSISQATIYNTLHVFCHSGLIREIAIEGHKSFYDTLTHSHPHYYHEEGGLLFDAPNGIVDVVINGEPPEGSQITDIDIVIRLASTDRH